MKREDGTFLLKNVRLNFPSLFEFPVINGEVTGKYQTKIMLDNSTHAQAIAALRAECEAIGMAKHNWKKGQSLKEMAKQFVDDFDAEIDDAGATASYSVFTAKSKTSVPVLGRDGRPLSKADGEALFYSGCRANVKVRAYPYDKPQRGVAFGLVAVQFAGEGQPLSGGHVPLSKAVEGFEGLDSDPFGDD